MNPDAALAAAEPHMRMPRARSMQRFARRLGLLSRDPIPDVEGMTSIRKLRLLNSLVSFLPPDGSECYLEIGTYQGKSLIGALRDNPGVVGVACDNFSEWDDAEEPVNERALRSNLANHGLAEAVRFFDCDFRELLADWKRLELPPAGVYFIDGPHDEQGQYDSVALAEPVLADRAIVLVDDWRHAHDSDSYAEAGTLRAVADSPHNWSLERVLPARRNGDLDLWWNGLAVLRFARSDGRSPSS